MKGYHGNIETLSTQNTHFRQVLYSAKHMQLVLMSLKPGEDIGEEIHADNDQFFRFESGIGECIIDGNSHTVKDGDAIVVPAGSKHNIINRGSDTDLKMYTIYAPAHHRDQIVRHTKQEAEENEANFDGVCTE